MKYRSYSHISICLLSLYFLQPFLSLLTSCTPSLFPVFSLPLFLCLLQFANSSKGVFYTHNTSFPLALLSLCFTFSSLFSFSSLLSFFLFLPSLSLSLSLSLQILGAATATMPHRFRWACYQISILVYCQFQNDALWDGMGAKTVSFPSQNTRNLFSSPFLQ